MNLKIISIIVLFIVLAGGVGFYIWHDLARITAVQEAPKNGNTTTIDNGTVKVGVEGDNTEGLTIKQVPIPPKSNLPVMPNLSRPINIPASSLPEESKIAVKAQIENLQEELKKDPSQYGKWLQLGLDWKFINDFEGARLSWEYAAAIGPDSFIAFNNLGDLYAYYLHDNAKAEANYKLALVKGSNMIYVWRAAYDFYRNVLKNDVLAKKTLEDGIAKNPNTSKDLQYLLDHFNS